MTRLLPVAALLAACGADGAPVPPSSPEAAEIRGRALPVPSEPEDLDDDAVDGLDPFPE